MAEENKIDNLFRSKMNSLDIPPPEKSRIAIEAALERQRGVAYLKKIQNYRMLTIVLGLILISSIAYFNFDQSDNNSQVKHKETKVTDEAKELNVIEKNAEINITNSQVKLSTEPVEIKKNKNSSLLSKNFNSEDYKNGAKTADELKIKNTEIYSEKPESGITFFANPIELAEINSEQNNNFLNSKIEVNSSTASAVNATPNSLTDNPSLSENIQSVTKIPVSLALFYSPHYSYCIFTDNTPDNNVDEVKMYNDIEDSEFSYSTGFSIRYNLSERWGFSTGLTYATVVKSVSLLTVYADKNSQNEMYYAYPTSSGMIEIPDPRNNTSHVGDTLHLDGAGEKILKYIHVPLLARYTINKNKIKWFFNSGPSVNFLVQDKAKISAENREEIIYNKTQGLKKISYGFIVGAGMEYKLTNSLNLLLEPVFKGTFTSITENTSVKNYPYSIGANFGLSLDF